MLFLNAKQELQEAILRKLKEKSGKTWVQIAKELKVSKSMIFLYLDGTCKIPKFRLALFCELARINLQELKLNFFDESINQEKQIKTVELNEKLSEFLGILSGDGCLETKGYATTVTCGKCFDEKYILEKVAPMFEQLFGIKPKVFSKEGKIYCRVYSKQLWNYLNKEFYFPIGEKKNKLKIPDTILTDEKLLKSFLRGLFDTDGGIHRHYKTTAQIQITSHSTEFRNQVWASLKKLGFKAGMTCENINIYEKSQIDKFFKEIGSNNTRNLERYKKFKETGVVPLQRELAKLIRQV